MKTLLSYLFFFIILDAQSQTKSNIQLAVDHFIGKQPFELGKTFTNSFGEAFTPNTFKYYISDIGFVDDSGKFYPGTRDCFLIDEAEPETKRIALNILSGKYAKLRFAIGVDSLRSIDGVHEGALDPYHGMFWTWNTGFVSAKLEGTTPVSKMPQQMFQYHIGGFRTGQNSLRTIEILLDSATYFSTGHNTLITINGDLGKWFNGKHQLAIAQNPFVHSPGELANKYADNYSTMFTLKSIRAY